MATSDFSHNEQALLIELESEIARLVSASQIEVDDIARLDAEQASLGYHPNYTAYVHGGLLADKKFGASHILPNLGFHDLAWRDALQRLAIAPTDADDDPECLINRLRHACDSDAMLEVSGHALLKSGGLLKNGSVNVRWLKDPKLGLGQAAKMFGLEPGHASPHRGLYAPCFPTIAS